MDIVIRKIEMADARGYWSAFAEVAKEKKHLLRTKPPPFEQTESFIQSNLEKNHAHYVAVQGDTIIGEASIIPLSRPTMTHVGVLGMFVVADYRGQGVGSQLLDKVIEHAWSRGLKRLELEVFADNEPAIRLYKKYGYVQEGVKRYARFIDGQYQDLVIMAQYCIKRH